MKTYITTIYRNGERENSSYPIGVFSSRESAEEAGRKECLDSGYKYGYEVEEFILDHHDLNIDRPLAEIVFAHGNPNWKNPNN